MPKAVKILSDYFNTGDGKRPLPEFAKEIRALSEDEKNELAAGAAKILGVTFEK